MSDLTCTQCGDTFTLAPSVAERFPGWTPSKCRSCHETGNSSSRNGPTAAKKTTSKPRKRSKSSGQLMTTAEVLEQFHDGPQTGVFTDGSSVPNPGPGGWGAVYVVEGQIIGESYGHEPTETTNNRMELMALDAGCDLVPTGTAATIYSDSNLVVRTINEWAAGWKRRGWKRKTGPVENLDLVKPLYEKVRSRPELKVEWIRAHDGSRWNEYADSLATAWQRSEV